jgi:hypothetical protein
MKGVPEFRPYRRGARRPRWVTAVLAKLEVEHGPPVPTCWCGSTEITGYGVCLACGRSQRDTR